MPIGALHPEGYHGDIRRPGFFEGWYLRLVDATGQHSLAFIPGIALPRAGGDAHAFVQVFDGVQRTARYYRFPVDAFSARRDAFDVCLGANRFSLQGMALDLDGPEARISGEVRFRGGHGWPVTALSPGAMGPFAYIPLMECYHGVLSFDHALEGALQVGGRRIVWDGGRGYIEKDWGRSFPRAWVWAQSNHFATPATCLMASAAIIPWLGATFRGFVVGLWRQGHLLHWATYTGARLAHLAVDDEAATLEVRGGAGAPCGWRLRIVIQRAAGVRLAGPADGAMTQHVPETLSATVAVRLCRVRRGREETLFEDVGRHTGFEAVGDLRRLLV